MNWKLIVKDKKKQPTTGDYTSIEWREQIADECFYQCVYCSIHEGQFGGPNNYHIDHFRPKSIPKFKPLENDICNLFYACPICNRFKSNDWPAEPDLDAVSYPDPSQIDYSGLFVLQNDFQIEGNCTASQYLVLRLFLNRAQLIMERREEIKVRQATELMKELSDLIDKVGEADLKEAYEALKEVDKVKNNIQELSERRKKIRPYGLKDIRKN